MQLENYKSFETERLLIRPTSLDDAEFIFQLLNSPKWLQNIGDRNICSIKDAEKYISAKMHTQLTRLGFSNNTVIRKSDQRKIGTCGLIDREGLDSIDIGFAFMPEFEKMGYAFEAASVLMKAARNEFKLKELSAITLEENTGSRNLLKKLGFEFQEKIKIPNDPKELMLYYKEL
ncbi:GNAT family N-acetyltransferase [Christiangramia forsetii]|uniref:GNAT family acetyltransferase n=2 Tax=Christiangramia forsetii TaxID=411153 RepID=A0M643_CHRFK|nr:GNAT family N-acetyltransferase [Christiangramia forsetii]GGG31451.1 alanine acetyltransferase [Christiangramia forsetii]CAL68088.1 GNAT family acetyltransferase [Christiangramia forsetii KT0803]